MVTTPPLMGIWRQVARDGQNKRCYAYARGISITVLMRRNDFTFSIQNMVKSGTVGSPLVASA